MEVARRPGMYNITETAIVAHATSRTVAHSDAKKASRSSRAPARDLIKHRRAQADVLTDLIGEFSEGFSKLAISRGLAVPYTTNVIQRYTPPRACDRLKNAAGDVILPRSEKTVPLNVRLIAAYTSPNEQVVVPCTGTMNDAIAGLSINRYFVFFVIADCYPFLVSSIPVCLSSRVHIFAFNLLGGWSSAKKTLRHSASLSHVS
jgi:hypothetical protein